MSKTKKDNNTVESVNVIKGEKLQGVAYAGERKLATREESDKYGSAKDGLQENVPYAYPHVYQDVTGLTTLEAIQLENNLIVEWQRFVRGDGRHKDRTEAELKAWREAMKEDDRCKELSKKLHNGEPVVILEREVGSVPKQPVDMWMEIKDTSLYAILVKAGAVPSVDSWDEFPEDSIDALREIYNDMRSA